MQHKITENVKILIRPVKIVLLKFLFLLKINYYCKPKTIIAKVSENGNSKF